VLKFSQTHLNFRRAGFPARFFVFLSLKMTDTQIMQAWYQFLVKKDMDQTDKAIKIARKNMVTSRLVRDEKRYYESWLAELEKELAEGV